MRNVIIMSLISCKNWDNQKRVSRICIILGFSEALLEEKRIFMTTNLDYLKGTSNFADAVCKEPRWFSQKCLTQHQKTSNLESCPLDLWLKPASPTYGD